MVFHYKIGYWKKKPPTTKFISKNCKSTINSPTNKTNFNYNILPNQLPKLITHKITPISSVNVESVIDGSIKNIPSTEFYSSPSCQSLKVAHCEYFLFSTINPILYNVMSHRYRVAFKETLCGKRRGSYYQNGFLRDQSSFRETTTGGSGYDRVHSVRIICRFIKKNLSIKNEFLLLQIRVRSIRGKSFLTDRESIKSDGSGGGLWRKKTNEFTKPINKVGLLFLSSLYFLWGNSLLIFRR